MPDVANQFTEEMKWLLTCGILPMPHYLLEQSSIPLTIWNVLGIFPAVAVFLQGVNCITASYFLNHEQESPCQLMSCPCQSFITLVCDRVDNLFVPIIRTKSKHFKHWSFHTLGILLIMILITTSGPSR